MRLRSGGWLAIAALISLPVYGVHAWAQEAAAAENITIEQPVQSDSPEAQPDSPEASSDGEDARLGASEAQPAADASGAAEPSPAITETTITVPAQASVEPTAVQKAFEKRFPEIEVEGVETTPFPGLYEVRIGADLLYVNADVDYILQGSLIDAKRRADLTAERMDELSRVDFSELPLELAIKQVKGDGSRVMAIFEDPNCGYCKQLHNTLKDVDNITVYTFLFPILSPDSSTKARDIWCAQDRSTAWRDWMLGGKKPANAECDTPVEQTLALGKKLKVQGTPAIFFADGSRINGALPLDALNQKLDMLK